MRSYLRQLLVAFGFLLAARGACAQPTQTTAFTYQGQLNAGGVYPTGIFQFTFTLFPSSSGGAALVGAPVIMQPIQVINGLFTTDLDFGPVFTGSQYWLEIKVGTTVGNEEALSERQPINSAPVAQLALRSALVFTANVINPTTVPSFFFAPNASGDPTQGGNWASFEQASVPMPAACTFDRLYLNLSSVPQGLGGGGQTTITLYVNGNATSLTVSGDTTTGAFSGGSVTGSVPVNLGDAIALQASGAGLSAGQGTISASLHCL